MTSYGKRIISIIAIALMVLCIFSACGKSNNFRIGVDDTYPPMEYKDDKNVTVGFDVDLAKAIADKLGKKAEFVSTAWDGIFAALNSKKFDCIISSVSLTPDRLKKYIFTKPYVANSQVIVVRPDNNDITKPGDLAGKKVGVQTATTASDAAEKLQKTTSFKLTKYDQIIQTFDVLKTKRIDAIVVDLVVARDYVKKHPESYKVSSVSLTNEPIAVCFKKNNTKLRDKVQDAIDELSAEGRLAEISIKWFGEDLTKNIDDKLRGND